MRVFDDAVQKFSFPGKHHCQRRKKIMLIIILVLTNKEHWFKFFFNCSTLFDFGDNCCIGFQDEDEILNKLKKYDRLLAIEVELR